MQEVEIIQEIVKMQCRKMSNGKALEKDAVQGYWLKNQSSLHPRIAVELKMYVLYADKLCISHILINFHIGFKKQRPEKNLRKCYQCSVNIEIFLDLKVCFSLETY